MSGGMAALPCDTVTAGREQHKVEVAAKKRKMVTINRDHGDPTLTNRYTPAQKTTKK